MERFTKISLCAALVAASLASTAQAETASTTVNVYAGLASVMQLQCGPVNFGVWRVPAMTRSAATTITLPATGDPVVTAPGADDANISLSIKWTAPARSSCLVLNSAAADGVKGTVAFAAGVNTGTFLSNGGTGSLDAALGAPEEPLTDFTYALVFTEPSAMDEGLSRFDIHGTMSIPAAISSKNLGGYEAAANTITFDDGL